MTIHTRLFQGLTACLLAVLAPLFLGFAATPAARAEPQSPSKDMAYALEYSVYASGFRTLYAQADLLRTATGYNATIDIRTDGMFKRLAPWSGVLRTEGRIAGDALTPKVHSFDNIWRGSPKSTIQDYDATGALTRIVITENGREPGIKTPDPALSDGATDILTAVFYAMAALDETGTCNTTQTVFDGKRRFDTVFTEQGRTAITPSRYTGFSGEAIRCAVEIFPKGGKWGDKPRGWMSIQEQSRERGQLPLIWFGQPARGAGYIPVKLQVKTAYGTLVLHLKNIRTLDPADPQFARPDTAPMVSDATESATK